MKKILIIICILGTIGALSGCSAINKVIDSDLILSKTPIVKNYTSEDLSAEHSTVDLQMRIGTLNLTSTDAALFDGTVTTNVEKWLPTFSSEGREEVMISLIQPEESAVFSTLSGDVKNQWDIKLSDSVPVDLSIATGVGKSNINLDAVPFEKYTLKIGVGEVSTSANGNYDQAINANIEGGVGDVALAFKGTYEAPFTLDLKGGVGDFEVDLSGDFKDHSLVNLSGGVGNISIILPKNTPYKITVDTGIGNFLFNVPTDVTISSDANSTTYFSKFFDDAEAYIELNIEMGIGNVTIEK